MGTENPNRDIHQRVESLLASSFREIISREINHWYGELLFHKSDLRKDREQQRAEQRAELQSRSIADLFGPSPN